MNKYLEDTRYAANGLIELYMHEIRAYKDGDQASVAAGEAVKRWNAQFAGKDILRDAPKLPLSCQLDDLQQHVTQFRENFSKMMELEATLKTRQFAFQVVCGALLQIAKQAISVTYGRDWNTKCPLGRAIGAETLRNVIWEGRNQAMHYEDNSPHKGVRKCFANLESCFGENFSLSAHPSTNLAAHIIDLLKWHSYETYEKDMQSLLPT